MSKNPSAHPARRRNFYGRNRGKRLRPGQKKYLDEHLPLLVPDGFSLERNPERHPVDISEVFGRSGPVWLEIGFGAGEHLVDVSAEHSDIGMIGCEPFMNGVASLLRKLSKHSFGNVRIYPGDVRDLFDVLPTASIHRVFLLYPDPWPKRRHHRRRFVTPEHIEPLSRVMANGALLLMATDVPGYARQAIEQVNLNAGFEWTAECCDDWRRPWKNWNSTRYELKALREGRQPIYLVFRRKFRNTELQDR